MGDLLERFDADGRRGGHREEGGGRYILVDLINNAIVINARMRRRGQLKERIGFDEKSMQLVVKVSGGGEYRYKADGALVDYDAADAALLSSTNYTDVISPGL